MLLTEKLVWPFNLLNDLNIPILHKERAADIDAALRIILSNEIGPSKLSIYDIVRAKYADPNYEFENEIDFLSYDEFNSLSEPMQLVLIRELDKAAMAFTIASTTILNDPVAYYKMIEGEYGFDYYFETHEARFQEILHEQKLNSVGTEALYSVDSLKSFLLRDIRQLPTLKVSDRKEYANILIQLNTVPYMTLPSEIPIKFQLYKLSFDQIINSIFGFAVDGTTIFPYNLLLDTNVASNAIELHNLMQFDIIDDRIEKICIAAMDDLLPKYLTKEKIEIFKGRYMKCLTIEELAKEFNVNNTYIVHTTENGLRAFRSHKLSNFIYNSMDGYVIKNGGIRINLVESVRKKLLPYIDKSDTSILLTSLNRKIQNSLIRKNIRTIKDLLTIYNRNPKELRAIPNIGAKSYDELISFIETYKKENNK